MRDTRYENGSALILAVVLTSLLAVVGVLFLMVARVDKIATSAISDNRELDMAIEAVTAQIAQELALDVPGDPNRDEEYHDYPDLANRWLASSEPYEYQPGSGSYRWLYLTDIYDVIYNMYPQKRRIDMQIDIVPDYQDPAYVGDSSGSSLKAADADGDGVADSIWAEMPEVTSSKGWPIYAAVRVIDNSAMLNVNTAYKFDPCEVPLLLERIDGSSQMQINLIALAERGTTYTYEQEISSLWEYRCGNEPHDISAYEQNVVWRYNEPNGLYTPFDISDELELRNRFLLNQQGTYTRIEQIDWTKAFRNNTNLEVPRTSSSTLDDWFQHANISANPDIYDYRHIATTYNMDRIIRPDGGKMLNVNELEYVPTNETSRIIRMALIDAGDIDVSATAAQITANLIDFRDYDEIVTPVVDDVEGGTYYGFERPCTYISELVRNFTTDANGTHTSYAIELYKPYFEDEDPVGWQLVIDNPPRVVDVNWSGTRRFHVIEWQDPEALLSATFLEPNSPNPLDGAMWVDPMVELAWPARPRAAEHYLYLGTGFEDVNGAGAGSEIAILTTNTYDVNDYNASGLQPKTTYYWRVDDVNGTDTWKGDVWRFTTTQSGSGYSTPIAQVAGGWSPGETVFDVGSVIKLRRFVPGTSEYITVDSVQVPDWLVAGTGTRSLQRDITLHKCIRRLWADVSEPNGTLSYRNNYVDDLHPELIQAHPYLDPSVYGIEGFKNIGEIGKVFAVDACGIGRDDIEENVRINLADARYQQIFNYLTVFDPTADLINNDGDRDANLSEIIDEFDLDLDGYPEPGDELKIPGRININTAPWYVIAQLPWMTPEIAQAIAFYRHAPQGPFRSIGQLNNVNELPPLFSGPISSIHYYGRADGPYAGDQMEFPDLTPADGADDDLEERDLIFARISNLVTVRSDVFTAYILVRIGADGPQTRAVAILDRSNVYYDPGTKQMVGRVKVIALHSVPDPR